MAKAKFNKTNENIGWAPGSRKTWQDRDRLGLVLSEYLWDIASGKVEALMQREMF